MDTERARAAAECPNNWRDGTCPECGECHYVLVRRNAVADAVAKALKERHMKCAEKIVEQAEEIAGLKKNRIELVVQRDEALMENARLQERLDAHAEIVAEAVAAERERCVQIVTTWTRQYPPSIDVDLAAALRAPGQP